MAVGAVGVGDRMAPAQGGERAAWEADPGAGAAIAEAGERLLARHELAFLATVAPGGRPRVHPFLPKVVDGRLVAFVGHRSPKRRDLEQGSWFTVHALPGEEDEELWCSGHAARVDGPERRERAVAALPFTPRPEELLYELDVALAMRTTWLDFGRPGLRPVHQRWREG